MTSSSYEAWRKEAQRTLRDKPLDSLVRKDEDAIAVAPLYTAESPEAAAHVIAPGPIRATRTWLVGQSYQRPSVAKVAAEIARDAKSGVETFVVVLDRAIRLGLSPSDPRAHDLVGKAGVAVASAADLAKLLENVPKGAHLFVDAGGNGARVALAAKKALADRGLGPSDIVYMAAIDPLGALASEGRLPRPMADLFAEAREVKKALPSGPALLATGLPYHEAGATAATELGAILATLLEYMRAGFAIGDVAVAVSADAEVLRGIAKVRALRLLVAKLAGAAGAPATQPFILGVTSKRHLTVRDRETNMVRATVETFSLGVGGVDAIVTRPFDVPIGAMDSRAKRIAKNTQLILRDESYVGSGADPARGSFAAEAMTSALAEAGWNAMRAIEAEGGMTRSLLDGAIQTRTARAHEERQATLGRRKRVIVGVSEFAPTDHAVLSEWPARDEERAAERRRAATLPVDPALYAPAKGGNPESAIRLDRVRDAERFESIRAEADTLATAGARPRVLIAPLGSRSDYRARVEYATRLFEVCGFDVEVDAAFESTKGMPDVVVVASSDPVYQASGEDALKRIRARFPAAFIVLAGKRGPLAEALAAVEPSADVFVGIGVIAFLAGILQRIRIGRTDGKAAVQ